MFTSRSTLIFLNIQLLNMDKWLTNCEGKNCQNRVQTLFFYAIHVVSSYSYSLAAKVWRFNNVRLFQSINMDVHLHTVFQLYFFNALNGVTSVSISCKIVDTWNKRQKCYCMYSLSIHDVRL